MPVQVLIFSQFMQTIAWLKAEFKKQGINYRFISGDMPMKKRAQAIEAFQKVRSSALYLVVKSIFNKLISTTVAYATVLILN
jgi:SNF2 family DNA or RNA helicase